VAAENKISKMTLAEIRRAACSHPGCSATNNQIIFEPISRDGLMVAIVCPYGHRQYVQIVTEKESSQEASRKRRDMWRTGPCSIVYCSGFWKSKQGNKRYCPRCQQERDRESRNASNIKTQEKRKACRGVSVIQSTDRNYGLSEIEIKAFDLVCVGENGNLQIFGRGREFLVSAVKSLSERMERQNNAIV